MPTFSNSVDKKIMFEKFSKWYEDKNGFIFALSTSAALKIILALFNRPFNSDGVLYITAAQHFAAGHFKEGLALFPMPLYSLLIAMVHFPVPNWEVAAKLISLTSVVLATIPLYLLTVDLFNRRVAFWACLLLAVSPLPNDWAVDVVRGPVFVFFFLWAVYFAVKTIDTPKPVLFLLTAICSCLAFLSRVEGIILFPFFFCFTMGLVILKKKERIPVVKGVSTWAAFLVFLMVMALAIGGKGGNFNRLDEVVKKTQSVMELSFLDNYRIIYSQLEEMEKNSPYPTGRQNFAETARHFMPVIYLLGLLQIFVKVLFPLFLIPLFLGFRHSFKRTHIFILGLAGAYLLMVFYTYVERDFMQRRFLFAPVVLFYPWVALGVERIFNRLKSSSKPKIYLIVFMLVFFVTPVLICIQSVVKADNVIRASGKWLASQEVLDDAKLITNETRAAFFAGRKNGTYIAFQGDKYDFSAVEKLAIKEQADLLLIKVPVKKKALLKDFFHYKQLKKFTGKRRDVYIYGSPSLLLKQGVI
jgi:hypothetical protein